MTEQQTLDNEKAQWSCLVERSSDQKMEDFEGLTVGEVFSLKCSGEAVAWTSVDEIQVVTDEEEGAYQLVILETQELTQSGGQFLATTYRAPQENLEFTQLSDGTLTWGVSLEGLTVSSVLPEDSPEPPMPYGPYGPFLLVGPLWIWLLIIPVLLLLAAPVIALFRRWSWRRKVLDAKSEKKIAISPLQALYKAQRNALKTLSSFDRASPSERAGGVIVLRESLQDFLLHEFDVLVSVDLDRRSRVRIKRQLRPSRVQRLTDLALLFTEFSRAEETPDKVSKHEAQQLLERCRLVAQGLSEGKKKKDKEVGRGVA